MDKRKLHHIWTKVRVLRPTYFLVLFLVSLTVCVFALRENNLHMVQLRNDVYAADKSNGDVEGALRNLREYVYSHMNTALASGPNAVHPPIQLEYTYERLVSAASKKATSVNGNIYTDAQHYCEAAIPNGFSGRYRLSCIQSYVTQRGVTIASVPKNLYEFDFVSPKWSPDLAGWSLVASVIFLALFAIPLLAKRFISAQLKRHK